MFFSLYFCCSVSFWFRSNIHQLFIFFSVCMFALIQIQLHTVPYAKWDFLISNCLAFVPNKFFAYLFYIFFHTSALSAKWYLFARRWLAFFRFIYEVATFCVAADAVYCCFACTTLILLCYFSFLAWMWAPYQRN